jgi:hypothetical protein
VFHQVPDEGLKFEEIKEEEINKVNDEIEELTTTLVNKPNINVNQSEMPVDVLTDSIYPRLMNPDKYEQETVIYDLKVNQEISIVVDDSYFGQM